MAKWKKADNFTVSFPKTRIQLEISKKSSYAIAEVDKQIVEDGVSRFEKVFTIYRDSEHFDTKLMRNRSEREMVETGFESLESAESRANELLSTEKNY